MPFPAPQGGPLKEGGDIVRMVKRHRRAAEASPDEYSRPWTSHAGRVSRCRPLCDPPDTSGPLPHGFFKKAPMPPWHIRNASFFSWDLCGKGAAGVSDKPSGGSDPSMGSPSHELKDGRRTPRCPHPSFLPFKRHVHPFKGLQTAPAASFARAPSHRGCRRQAGYHLSMHAECRRAELERWRMRIAIPPPWGSRGDVRRKTERNAHGRHARPTSTFSVVNSPPIPWLLPTAGSLRIAGCVPARRNCAADSPGRGRGRARTRIAAPHTEWAGAMEGPGGMGRRSRSTSPDGRNQRPMPPMRRYLISR